MLYQGKRRSDKLKCWYCRAKPTDVVMPEDRIQPPSVQTAPAEKGKKSKRCLICADRQVIVASSWGNHALRQHLMKQKDTKEGQHW